MWTVWPLSTWPIENTQICRSETQWFIRNTREFHTWRDDYINVPSKHTLTLCDGKDQIPLLQELPVQPWRSEEEVCDRGQTCSANGWLDVLLQTGVGAEIQYHFKIIVRAINHPLDSYLNIYIIMTRVPQFQSSKFFIYFTDKWHVFIWERSLFHLHLQISIVSNLLFFAVLICCCLCLLLMQTFTIKCFQQFPSHPWEAFTGNLSNAKCAYSKTMYHWMNIVLNLAFICSKKTAPPAIIWPLLKYQLLIWVFFGMQCSLPASPRGLWSGSTAGLHWRRWAGLGWSPLWELGDITQKVILFRTATKINEAVIILMKTGETARRIWPGWTFSRASHSCLAFSNSTFSSVEI